jgi:hypothetical protein
LDARTLEHPELGGVAVLNGVLELFLDGLVAAMVGLDQRDLSVLGDQLSTLPAPAMITYISESP